MQILDVALAGVPDGAPQPPYPAVPAQQSERIPPPAVAGEAWEPGHYGSKVVGYQCVHPMASTTSQSAYSPNLTYNYRSDRELLAASQNAQSYCTNEGGQRVISSITSNADGTRTATFQCSP